MASISTGTALASLLLTLPLTALSASLPDTSSTAPQPTTTSETRSLQPHLSTGVLVAVTVVPILVVLVVSASLYFYCRSRGHSLSFRNSKIREIVSPVSPTNYSRGAFYELGRKEGYESITPLHPTLDHDSPRSSTTREPWRQSHTRNDTVSSIGSTGSLHMTMSGALSGSPHLGPHDPRSSGRYTPISGRESPALGHTRARTQTSTSTISLPLHGADQDLRRCSSPLAWNAEQITSDGSDRATPVPWEYRAETEGKSRSRSATPQPHHSHSLSPPPRTLSPEQDIASMSPYYDPHIAARRMSIPMVLSIPATPATPNTPLSIHHHVISETEPLEEEDEEEEGPAEAYRKIEGGDKRMSRSQTLKSINSVTTIRTSVDTQFTDWQLPAVDEHEEMPKLPAEGLRRSSAIRRASSGLS